MVARSKRDGSGEQHLSRHDRIALRRFESGEPEAVLRIIGHVEIHVRLPTVQPPQGFRGNRRICRQGAVRHLGDERRRNRIVGTGNVASRCVARTHPVSPLINGSRSMLDSVALVDAEQSFPCRDENIASPSVLQSISTGTTFDVKGCPLKLSNGFPAIKAITFALAAVTGRSTLLT